MTDIRTHKLHGILIYGNKTLMQKNHLWRFHLNSGINGIFGFENLGEKTALFIYDVFCKLYLHMISFYVLVDDVGICLCTS
jgi:hypothetical protein